MYLKPCPKCGATKGYWSSHRMTQYYDTDGKPTGYSLDGTGAKNVHCLACGKRISTERIKNRRAEGVV